MSDIEKSPLLPQAGRTTADGNDNLTELRERADAAHKSWIEATKEYHTAWRKTPSGRLTSRVHTCIVVFFSSLFLLMAGLILVGTAYVAIFDDDTSPSPRGRIPLEAHIMSKCPDARDCLRDMVLPAMMHVGNEVDFKLSYIGKLTPEDDGVSCMHGPGECLGDMLELCAGKLYPNPKTYLGFTMCLTKDYKEVPQQSLVQDCALEHGLDFNKLNACASDDSGKGLDLLRSSVQRSQVANVTTSCTVRVDDKVWCVRDDGEWKGCDEGSSPEDLVRKIKQLREE